MDKLRALHYFLPLVEEGSIFGAASQNDVSVPVVSKLIA